MIEMGTSAMGLDGAEVRARQERYGWNEISEEKKDPVWKVFFSQFRDFLVGILIFAAGLSAFLGKPESALVIMLVVVLNALLGTAQHLKAEQSLASLKRLTAPTAKVVRDGEVMTIPSREIVRGDLLVLDAGDHVGADGRVVSLNGLQVNESSLTGESEGVQKTSEELDGEDLPVGDRRNMVYAGSFVTYGRGTVVVAETGMGTELGRIAALLGAAEGKKTPLQENLDRFGKKLAVGILFLTGVLFALDVFRGRPVLEAVMFSVSLAVAAIPEALSSIVTIVLSFGTQKFAKENAVVRKLHAVEALGGVSVICSDKTGTLTMNQMTVKAVYVDGEVVQDDSLDMTRKPHRDLLLMGVLCSDALTVEGKEIGDPTEIALVDFAEKYGMDEVEERKAFERTSELPFDSERKLMSTLNRIGERSALITKGAPDVVLGRAGYVETAEGIRPITHEDVAEIERANTAFSEKGLRVLAFAFRYIEEGDLSLEHEDALVFSGLMAMMDPPRPEAFEAIRVAKEAGIRTVMITGDHRITASTIAKQLGILEEGDTVLEGKDLETMSEELLREKVRETSVYARVSPEHKIRIVRAWQENGMVVSMTGDGVNDAPALRQADIGVAMGITGTEVSKDAASIVLADDNFATIIKAVSEGRRIYENIRSAIRFLLSGNASGLITVAFASLFSLPAPFSPVHLLFINLVTDSLPAIAIGLEPSDGNLMKEKPRDPKEPLLDRTFVTQVTMEGLLMGAATITAFLIGLRSGDAAVASTMAFATLGMTRLLHGFSSRSKEPLSRIGFFSNRILVFAVALGFVMMGSILNLSPLMAVFEVVPLTPTQGSLVVLLSAAPLILIQSLRELKAVLSKREHVRNRKSSSKRI